ncbi:MAG TPA: translation initiation factor IF-2 [Anaerolineaceae bacterium]|nr:translation initiation factor IF-2 [Anaerolineaceae bacterium]HNZ12124.1 translation initiation factor IF-2 [Anaerolineaceae bacterium]HOD03419.1 translation initiation factor IF-2 [Anaerolineaceae bacterium]HOG78478.1 translation initiation factor IF-2 [Anaerolineaceae bacterium]
MSEQGQKQIELPAVIIVRDLAAKLETSPIKVMKILMDVGVMANINQQVDFDTAAVVASEMGFEAHPEAIDIVEEKETGEIPLWRQLIANEDQRNLANRAPVVTILGHVDHGKTTLLDAIRHTNVAGGEAGGITQHIGAYQVEHKGHTITFLDTPGHAAFTAMRSRGAQGADVVVLVVAANDGVMPQTREAIAHARAARVPIIVAMNKVDLDGANPDFVKRQLADMDLVPDEWEGNTLVVPVSAKLRRGIEDLLEAILLVAENMDIQANPNGRTIGTVIEAKVDRAKGVVATLLVQNGTLSVGDIVLAGTAWGRIRAMFDFRGRKLQKAGPSTPVQIMGLSEVPEAGDLFQVLPSDREARQVVEDRRTKAQAQRAAAPKATLEELFSRVQSGEERELRLIVKADVQGSLEPIINELNNLGKESTIGLNVLHAETGNISENDVMLATASHAIVIGFNVQADLAARRLAETEGVSIRLYNIIYRLTEDIEKALKGMLAPEIKEVVVGRAEVLAVFKISKVGNIAGCKVKEGELRRNGKVRLLRAGETLYEGDMSSLKHEKEDVNVVRLGFECGVALRNFTNIEPGDVVECYVLEKSL